MTPTAPRNRLAFVLILGSWALCPPAHATTPTPTGTTAKQGVQATPTLSTTPQLKESKTTSSILKKTAAHKTRPSLEPLGLYYNQEFSGTLLDYNKLNADLDPLLSDRPHRPTADEKFWGTVAGAAGYGMAGVAAGQALGLLPSDRDKKKK